MFSLMEKKSCKIKEKTKYILNISDVRVDPCTSKSSRNERWWKITPSTLNLAASDPEPIYFCLTFRDNTCKFRPTHSHRCLFMRCPCKNKSRKNNNALESGPRVFLTLTSHQNNRLKRCINTLGTESRPDRTSADPVNVLTYGPWICFAVDQHRSDSCIAVFPPHKREWERLSETPNVFLLAGG